MRFIPGGVRLLILLSHLPFAGVSAQWPPEIVPGARVQAQLPEAQFQPAARRGHQLRGRVVGLAADTLYLAVTDSVGSLAIPRNLIKRLDYSRGVPSRTSSALARGLRSGIASALVLVLWNEFEDEEDRTSTGTPRSWGVAWASRSAHWSEPCGLRNAGDVYVSA